jgi:hypothetical protein
MAGQFIGGALHASSSCEKILNICLGCEHRWSVTTSTTGTAIFTCPCTSGELTPHPLVCGPIKHEVVSKAARWMRKQRKKKDVWSVHGCRNAVCWHITHVSASHQRSVMSPGFARLPNALPCQLTRALPTHSVVLTVGRSGWLHVEKQGCYKANISVSMRWRPPWGPDPFEQLVPVQITVQQQDLPCTRHFSSTVETGVSW